MSHAEPKWCGPCHQWECPAPKNAGKHISEWKCGCTTEAEEGK
jgi:hypothetical protein